MTEIIYSKRLIRTIVALSLLFLAFFGMFGLLHCRFIQRDDYVLSNNVPHRSGLLENHLFTGKPTLRAYPDLGLVLANAQILKLHNVQLLRLKRRAVYCQEKTEPLKKEIKRAELDLKGKLALSKLQDSPLKNGKLAKVAPELNEIEKMRENWLRIHEQCYRSGLSILTFSQRMEWLPIENLMLPLPGNTNNEEN